MASASGPIADLSYRNYDGPLEDVGLRWWVIAKMFMRMALKKRYFWTLAVMSTFGYVILSIIFYFVDTFSDAAPGFGQAGRPHPLNSVVWKEQVFVGFSQGQLWLFLLTLLIGAGAVAADSRANALLVYLSKPVSKWDYVFGKWLGMFLMVLAVTGVPVLLFTGFTWMSYREYGSWDSWLFFKVLLLMPIPAFIHASIMLGCSSMFNQGRLAGATYAGIYFISIFLSAMAAAMRAVSIQRGQGTSSFLDQASYLSVDGIINGLGKVVLDTSGTNPFDIGRRRMMSEEMLIPKPNGLLFTFIFLGVSALFVYVAWKRVRAVEVVGG